ncbi:MAG TPA: TOPRIM nucleotidyl transferase/hydrolase domain-containing protein [Acidimicrobiales bacterium]
MTSVQGDSRPSTASPGIARLDILGFRTLRETSLRAGPLNVLVGEANAGKSNVLAAIATVLGHFEPPSERQETSPAFSIHAHLGDGGVVSAGSAVELDVPGTHRPCPIYLPSSLRSSTLVATRHVAHHRAAGAHRMLTSALHEQLGADPRPSPASVASGLVTALERCCDEGMGGFVFLVEEPELYLRPQAQRYLYRVLHQLAEGGNQVFYSTHSPAFLNVARMEELNLVIRDPVLGTRLERPQPLPASESFRVMSEFDAERGEVFLAEAAVLVEGRTEKLALPHVFSALGHDPDRSGITIVECGGKANIVMLARVCRAFGVPFCVVHDRDAPAGRQPSVGERRLNEEIARLAGSEHVVVLEPDFEGVSGLRRHNHKPEQAWRAFHGLTREAVPPPLARVVELAIGLAHRAGR